ncbi:MAG: arginine deiminase-related protein, partial [Chitinophagales bacterium]
NNEECKKVITELKTTNKKIIEITLEQVSQFAGNMLQIRNSKGEKVLTLSKQAYNSLTQYQISALKNHNDHIVMGAIYTIEKYGGGSVRCMMAEVFLPSV